MQEILSWPDVLQHLIETGQVNKGTIEFSLFDPVENEWCSETPDNPIIITSMDSPLQKNWELQFFAQDIVWTYNVNKFVAQSMGLSKSKIHFFTYQAFHIEHDDSCDDSCDDPKPEFFYFDSQLPSPSFAISYVNISQHQLLNLELKYSIGQFLTPCLSTDLSSAHFIFTDLIFIDIPRADVYEFKTDSAYSISLEGVPFNNAKTYMGYCQRQTVNLPTHKAIELGSCSFLTLLAVPWMGDQARFQSKEDVMRYYRKTMNWCMKRCRGTNLSKPCPATVKVPEPDEMGILHRTTSSMKSLEQRIFLFGAQHPPIKHVTGNLWGPRNHDHWINLEEFFTTRT